jgi:alkylation response protein AidB-like acyl-CoA dehydrogenase
MLVAQECGRVLAGVPLLGLLPATALLDAAGDDRLEALAAGELRDADSRPAWTVDRRRGAGREPAPVARVDGDALAFTGSVAWVPDAPGADLLVAVGTGPDGAPVAGVVEATDAAVEPAVRYDATRALGHVALDGAAATPLDLDADRLARAWYLAQALLAAEAVGAVEATLEMAVAYAKERFTFGRAIGSYQAIKHGLTEVLRLLENARSLLYYAGWAFADRPDEFPLAASAARSAAGRALDHATRQNITTHGGIGATWEHDAPLFFRRAQLTRRLLGGNGDATDRVAGELLAAAS